VSGDGVATQPGLIAQLSKSRAAQIQCGKFNAMWRSAKIHRLLYDLGMVPGMSRASSCFFSQALIIERAVVSASLRVPKTVLSSGSLFARNMNSHAPLLSRNSYSDRVTNASMLHEIILTEVAISVCDDDHGASSAHHRRVEGAPQLILATDRLEAFSGRRPSRQSKRPVPRQTTAAGSGEGCYGFCVMGRAPMIENFRIISA
jgi:hypothetical protein